MAQQHEIRCRILVTGGGPAGYTAAIYAARAGHRTVLVQGPQPGGQLTITSDVDNYPGFAETVQGPVLMEAMRQQAVRMGVTCVADQVTDVDFSGPLKAVQAESHLFRADAVIVATGARARWLGLPSEEAFRGYGVSACATCDGFFFRNQDVAVIGGGNAAVEEALFMANMARHVTLVHRRQTLRAEHVLQQRLLSHPKIRVVWDHVVESVEGTEDPRSVTGLKLRHVVSGEISALPVQGVFVAVGHVPVTGFLKGHLPADSEGYLVTRPGSTQTSVPGVFAAGDVQDKVYRQAVTAAGQGCMAALDADRYLALRPDLDPL
jgi:thioredoxin reductase (NADPH)